MKNFSSVFGNNIIEWKFSFAKGGCFKNFKKSAGPLFHFFSHYTFRISHGTNEFFYITISLYAR